MSPEGLQNDTPVKHFLGTINYCGILVGPAFGDLARPLVEVTKKGVDFKWTDEHTQAVKTLKDKLVNYVTLQVPDPAKPYAVKLKAAGYAVGAVLEQEDHWAS